MTKLEKGEFTRREFVKQVGKGTLAAGTLLNLSPNSLLAQGRTPSNQIRVALLGFGRQGFNDMRRLQQIRGVQIMGACDVYDGYLQHAREVLGDKVETTKDYRRFLDRKDVDAVLIATPDHWHARMVVDAASAGKDIYCEKPLTHTWEEGETILKTIADTGRVMQVGSGRVNSPIYQKAKEIVQSGRLGKITMVSACWDSSGSIYAYQAPIPPDASPDTIDWKTFLGSAPARDFDVKRFCRWRLYWDYSEGLAGDLFSHLLTAIHWILDVTVPTSAAAHGSIYYWKDGREIPDTFNVVYDYPEGFGVSLSSTQTSGIRGQEIQFLGTDATLVLSGGQLSVHPESHTEAYSMNVSAWPQKYREWFYMVHGLGPDGQRRNTPPMLETVERYELPRGASGGSAHMQDFVNCMRTRAKPAEPAELANNAALAVHMANLAYKNRTTVRWNAAERRMEL